MRGRKRAWNSETAETLRFFRHRKAGIGGIAGCILALSLPAGATSTTIPEDAPALTAALDEKAYPSCALEYQSKQNISDKIATLRYCRGQIEVYRQNNIVEFDNLLLGYNDELLGYDLANRKSSLPLAEKEKRTRYVQAELAKLKLDGSYRAGSRRMMTRYRTDTAFVVSQICTLRQFRHQNCE